MGDKQGFINKQRKTSKYRCVEDRVKDFKDVIVDRSDEETIDQASRCMDCGTPFCHFGCPIGNLIPEWNDAVCNKNWEKAYVLLESTNCLPEITGRLCPALCEAACVLGINDEPITIRENEKAIIEHAFKAGYIKAKVPEKRTNKRVAVIGSGPAGLAVSILLNRMGHSVTLFEKDEKFGGLLRYGIPDFKFEKWILDRRLELMRKEGIELKANTNIGVDLTVDKLKKDFNAICVTTGSGVPRDLSIKGRESKGIYFAMEYLVGANKRNEHEKEDFVLSARDKKVIVIGGGDTGSDCVGTAVRQGAKSVTQIELMAKPPELRTDEMLWPTYPMILRTSSSHEEGAVRIWNILTKEFISVNNSVKKLKCAKVETKFKDGKLEIKELEDFEINANLVILAMGFIHPEKEGLLDKLGLVLTDRGTIKTDDNYMTSVDKIYAAGDVHRGASLIVWAIKEAYDVAKYIDKSL